MLLDHLTDIGSYPTMATQDHFDHFYTSSPAVVLPPPSTSNQYFGDSHYVSSDASMANGFNDSFTPSFNGNISPSTGALAGRKRGRDDMHAPVDDGDLQDDRSTAASAGSERAGTPVFGPGGTVIYPNDPGFAAAVQANGMMVDGQEQMPFFDIKRPTITSRKSQRIDRSLNGSDELAQLVLPSDMREATKEPLIDEATRLLGISWTRMDSSESLQISKSAYEKWIQNHYPGLKEVTVWFENSALPGYLVAARNTYNSEQAFYLFANDLTEARMVTTDPAQLLPRLQLLPALHLAAPGGHLVAHTVAVSNTKDSNCSGPSSVPQEMESDVGPASLLRGRIQDYAYPKGDYVDDMPEPVGICAAHSMEMD
ncbi:Hypothetical protein R9X50_00277200 [Acrodontium crateriforme]|uniref:Uncharacterized protein n=1 Tax=Acrodontium crateriforme TaxID=150365 RepID=A0AAQ3M1X0_9PEZI|nr:Hypothetical protein R9X50_00277200 [Acrodontium crateriforme]